MQIVKVLTQFVEKKAKGRNDAAAVQHYFRMHDQSITVKVPFRRCFAQPLLDGKSYLFSQNIFIEESV